MRKIQELSEMLANQIAAGEVVERPASVVKELVENAIDAGSTQIDIFIEEAGLRKIQIIDNGEGISEDDVLNAFKRHATSKIHTRDDLFRIRTLGFRGEALPSIASVSELTIETSTGAEVGSFVHLQGGKVLEHKPHSLRKGTKITVEKLFYNTPARLKYVKSVQTELANIGDIVNRLAMSHPSIAFRLVHEGNKMLSTLGNGDVKQAIAGIYGIGTAKKMLPISEENLDFKVSGYISLPELTRASRNYLSLIINGRYIKNYLLNKAIVEGYGSKLMVGRFPIAVIEITMDPLLVDVNVHPTKQEVRLSKEKDLMELIVAAIQGVLGDQQLIPNAIDNLGFKRKVSTQPSMEQIKMPLGNAPVTEDFSSNSNRPVAYPGKSTNQGLAYDSKTGQFYVPKTPGKEWAATTETSTIKEETLETVEYETGSEERVEAEMVSANQTYQQETPEKIDPFDMSDWIPENAKVSVNPMKPTFEEPGKTPSNQVFPSETIHGKAGQHQGDLSAQELEKLTNRLMNEPKASRRFPELDYFGQMHGTYLFAQSTEGLYIIDQHAAQERVKYEFYRKQIGEVSEGLQELLVPIVIDYPSNDALRITEGAEILAEVGIHLEPFGQNSFLVRAHPTWYPGGQEEQIIREMIEMFLETGKVSVAKFREATAIMMSCKKSIKANHYLNDLQARVLLEDLEKCENPFNCPHGRPVLIQFTNNDMEKMFKRIQDPH